MSIKSTYMNPLYDKYVGKFIGPDTITDIILSDTKTPSGAEVFEVTLSSKRKRLFPIKSLACVVTDEAKDYNHIRDVRMELLVPELVALIEEYDVTTSEVEHMSKLLGRQLGARLDRALNWMWTKDDSLFVAGFDPMYDVSLLAAEQVIAQIPPKTDEPA